MMLADFFTKPLQSSLFMKMRDVVMGYQPVTILKTEEDLEIKKAESIAQGLTLKKEAKNQIRDEKN